MTRRLCLAAPLVALLLSACGGEAFVISTIASSTTSTAVQTIDLAMSRKTDEECSVMNFVDGDGYCRPRTVPSGRPQVHCFKTIGGVDCYTEKDPYGLAETGNVRPSPPLGADPVPARNAQKKLATETAAR